MSDYFQALKARVTRKLTISQQVLIALIVVNLLSTALFTAVSYVRRVRTVREGTDAKLEAVAKMAREMLPPDYHDRIVDRDSVSASEFHAIVDRNNRLCRELGLEYIWSLLLVDGKIVFTTSTSPDKVADNHKHAKFFEAHSNPELYTNTFSTLRATYRNNSDKWGDIRVVLIPSLDRQGRKYLFGASILLDEMNKKVFAVFQQTLSAGAIMFVISMIIGLFFAHLLTDPIRRMTSTIQRIEAGHKDLTVKEEGAAELATLARRFNQMNRLLQGQISALEDSRLELIGLHEVERKLSAEERLMSEQRYRGLLDFAVDGILIGSHEGIVSDANQCMCGLFGLERHEVIGKHVSTMPFTPESLQRSPFRFDLVQRGETVVSERTIRRRDGAEVVVEMHTKMMPDGTYQSIYHDITERKQIENSLLDTRRLLEDTQRLAHMGGWEYDLGKGRCAWTDEVYRIYGVGQDFDVNDSAQGLRFFLPPYGDVVGEAFVRARDLGEAFDVQAEFVRNDGQHIWVRSTGEAICEGGRIVKVVGTFTDISERKQIEDALQETRRLLDEAQRMAKMGAWKYVVDTGHIIWTDEVYRIHGVGRDFDTNNLERAMSFYAPESVPVIQQALQRAVEHGEPFDLELEFIRANGEHIWVRSCGRATVENGRTVSVSGSFMDINERKRAENELRNSEERYRLLFEMESDAILLMENPTGHILDCNQAAQTLYGYSRGELLNLRNTDLSAEPEQTAQATQAIMEEDKSVMRIALRQHRKRDGTVFPVEITARCFTMHGRSVHIAANRDITERVKAQELLKSWNVALERRVAERTAEVDRYTRQLQALWERLVRVEEDERRRIADVLHEDLQQTLVAARMTLGVTLRSIRSAPLREMVSRADSMVEQSVRLTRSLVHDIAVPAVREGNLAFAFQWLGQQMNEKFGLVVNVTDEAGGRVVSENVYLCLYRSVQELLFNVAKHAKVKQSEVVIRKAGEGFVEIVVCDRGAGFSADKLEAAEKGGDGFGLFSIRERVEGLGGKMEVVGKEGVGTTVSLVVPMCG